MAKIGFMATVSDKNNAPKGPVTILGLAYVGETLIAKPNSIGDADGIDFNTETFQWLRDGDPIVGATLRTYDVSPLDVGAHLSIRYSYVDFGGTLEVLTSDPEAIVPPAGTPLPSEKPFNLFAVLGDAIVGQTLTARPNGLKDDVGIDFSTASFRWLRDGTPISGADDQTYTVTDMDIGSEISVVFTYDDLLGTQKSFSSNPKPQVPMPDPVEPPYGGIDNGVGDESLLAGTSGSDTLTAHAGIKRISGQESMDTAFFEGNQSHYTLILDADGILVSDHRAFGLGTIALDDIERIDFGTETEAFAGPIDLGMFHAHTDLSREALTGIIELYIAYFNRAPDAIGLNFWASAFANGTSLDEMALLFADQTEMRAAYPAGTSHEAFTAAVYGNVLGRTPDQAGLDFWVSTLDSGAVSRDQLILRILEGAKAKLTLEQGYDFAKQQLADRAYLEDKVNIGAHFSVHRGMSDVENAAFVMSLFDGSDHSVNAAIAATDAFYQDAREPVDGEFLLQIVGVLESSITL